MVTISRNAVRSGGSSTGNGSGSCGADNSGVGNSGSVESGVASVRNRKRLLRPSASN